MQAGWSGNTIGEYSQLLFCHPNMCVIPRVVLFAKQLSFATIADQDQYYFLCTGAYRPLGCSDARLEPWARRM